MDHATLSQGMPTCWSVVCWTNPKLSPFYVPFLISLLLTNNASKVTSGSATLDSLGVVKRSPFYEAHPGSDRSSTLHLIDFMLMLETFLESRQLCQVGSLGRLSLSSFLVIIVLLL